MTEMDMYKRDAYFRQLERVLDQDTMKHSQNFIKRVTECRHRRVLDRQKAIFEVLVQQKTSGCSNKDVQKNRAIHSNNTKEDRKKWVLNLSSTQLTKDQEGLLAHGPKFVITPKETPVSEYITAVEQTCTKLNQGEQEELRVEVKRILKKTQRSPSNISKEEYKALNELKRDRNRLILTADKGVALVVIDKADYIEKAEELLNKETYKKIPEDPTHRQKDKLINILRNINTEGGLSEEAYRILYSTGAGSPKFYGLPKIHKPGIPLRPIISSIGTVT